MRYMKVRHLKAIFEGAKALSRLQISPTSPSYIAVNLSIIGYCGKNSALDIHAFLLAFHVFHIITQRK